jgi:FtsZ-binding cell division protein ZapB
MKAKLFFFAALFCLFSFTSLPLAVGNTKPATEEEPKKEITKEEYKEAIETLKERVDTLKEAKKNADMKEEKQKVKEEIKEVKREAKMLKQQERGGFGIYIGGGALLAILILVLLL